MKINTSTSTNHQNSIYLFQTLPTLICHQLFLCKGQSYRILFISITNFVEFLISSATHTSNFIIRQEQFAVKPLDLLKIESILH